MRRDWRRALPLGVALSMAIAGAGLVSMLPEPWAFWREPMLERLVLLLPAAETGAVAVVDIASARRDCWDRQDTQRLVAAIAEAGPSVVALDIVLSADCRMSAQNTALATALGRVPATLGILLSGDDRGVPRPTPTIAATEGLALPDIWVAAGAEHACAQFEAAATGSGVASLAGGSDGVVRAIPALAVAGERAYPGLAVDAVRLHQKLGTIILSGDPAEMRLGPLQLTIGPTASLRFRPSTDEARMARTVTADAVMSGGAARTFLTGKIVFVGDSAPEAGALRATAQSPLYPSVQIHADLAEGMLAGRLPLRPVWAPFIEGSAGVALGLVASVAGALLAPVLAGLIGLALVIAWIGVAVVTAILAEVLLDPVGVPAVVTMAGLAAMILQAARTRRAEIALRRRIGQLLPPDVVSRFVREPSLMRLEGEERVVTALFTDVEGFTQTISGIEPKLFVRVLDAYFTGMTQIVLAHGGMIDKLVGDAVHALFNAPADLPDHVDRAVACALQLHEFAEAFRQRPEMVDIRFGRTRIGIETGSAILGDVGAADKIDYTAHGAAINLAARLEQANKQLGTSICIGPQAAQLTQMPLRALGEIEVRSFGMVEVFTPMGASSAPP